MKTNYLTDKELSALIRHYNSLPNVSDALKAIHSDITSSNSINYENLYKNLFQSIKSDFSGVVPNELQGLLENLNEKALKQNNTKNKKIIDDSRDFSFNDLKQTTIKKYLLEIDYLTKMIEKDENSLEISSSDFNKSVIQNRLEEAKYLVESHREKINSIRSITSFRGTNGLLNALQGLGPIEKAKTTPLRISLSVRNRITKLFIEKGIEKASSKTIELENELADISAKLKNPNTINIRELKQKQAYLKRQRTYSLIKEKKLNEKEGRMLQSQRRIVDHMIARNLRFSQDFRLSEGKSSDRLYKQLSKSGEDSINSNIAIGLGVASSIFRNIKHSFQYPIQNYRETKRIYDRRKTISKDPEQAIDPNPTQTIESNTKNKFKDELAPLNGPAVQSVLRIFIANPNTVFKHAKINEIRKVKDSGKHLRTLTDMKLLQQQIDRNARGYNYTLNPEKLTEIEKIKPLLLNGSTTIDEINAYNMNNTKGASL